MGSSVRFAWTCMGDGVNLASRLEGQNKEYHSQIIIGENTYQQVREQFVCRDLDRIQVKGKMKPVKIYELLGWTKDASHYADLLSRWQMAQAGLLPAGMGHGGGVVRGPARAVSGRRAVAHVPEAVVCKARGRRSDPAWNGVFVATEK